MNDDKYEKIVQFMEERKEWETSHEKRDEERARLVPTDARIEEIVTKVFRKEIIGFGNGTYAWIKIIAFIIGSLTVIFGGFKIFLGWIGYIKP